jgi:hypothetical protein
VWWTDDTHVLVHVPARPDGTTTPIVLTVDGLSSAPLTLTYRAVAPTILAVTPARLPATGQRHVTVTVGWGTGTQVSGVSLVSTTSPTVTLTAPITARTASTVTFLAPAGPAGRDFHVVLANGSARSVRGPADVVGYRTALSARPSTTVVSAGGSQVITLTGSGFGTTLRAFQAGHITATIGRVTTQPQWVDDRTLRVLVPAGVPGSTTSVVLDHDGVTGPAITGLRYAAAVDLVARTSGPHGGWTTAVYGTGLAGTGTWRLVDGAGRTVATLPVVTSSAALSRATGGGVLAGSDHLATVRLPARAAGTYRLVFVPDQRRYPGATTLPTTRTTLVFAR